VVKFRHPGSYQQMCHFVASNIRDLVRTSLGSPTWSLSHSYNYLDSPNTTSAVTYKPYYKTSDSSKSMLFNNSYAVPITMTLLEIAG